MPDHTGDTQNDGDVGPMPTRSDDPRWEAPQREEFPTHLAFANYGKQWPDPDQA